MAQDFCEILISEVSKRRALWDINQKNYHNRHVSDREWTEVAIALGSTKDKVKNKWKSLRDAFRREIKKSNSSDAEAPKRISWCHFDSLMFLKDVIVPRETECSFGAMDCTLSKSIVNGTVLTDDESGTPDVFVETVLLDQTSCEGTSLSEESSAVASTPNESYARKRRKAEKSFDDQLKESKRKMLQSAHECEDTKFMLSLVPYMKQLDNFNKLDAMGKIISVLKEKLGGNM